MRTREGGTTSMIAKRFGALVVSVLLVVGALAIRSRLDRREDLDRSPLRVACAAELAAACEQLQERGFDLTIEPALTTSRRLSAVNNPAEVGTELWLTVQPAATLVDADRSRRGVDRLLSRDAVAVTATTDLALVVWNDRAAVLGKACPALTMRCVGDVAGRGAWMASGGPSDWGQVRIALPDPDQSAAGLLALGAGAQSWFGRSDLGSNDFDADPAFGDWLAGLARAAPRDASLARMLALGRAALDMAVMPRAVADEQVRGAAGVSVLQLEPSTPVEAVVVTLPGARGTADDLAGALQWPKTSRRGQALAADVLEALRLRWTELSR